MDCLADGKDAFIAGIMEHIEEAGIHSGDSACSLPPRSPPETIDELERQTKALALALDVGGLMNVQYAIKDGTIYVLEVNPRASRTVPFVAKVIGEPIAKIAARHGGESLAQFGLAPKDLPHIGVKEAVFPFARFLGVDVLLGPEMRSPARSSASTAPSASPSPRASSSAPPPRCRGPGPSSSRCATRTSPGSCRRCGCSPRSASRWSRPGDAAVSGGERREGDPYQQGSGGRPHVVDAIKNGDIQLVFNTTEGAGALSDSRSLRRAALLHKVPYYTTLAGAIAAAEGIKAYLGGDLEVRALQEYFS